MSKLFKNADKKFIVAMLIIVTLLSTIAIAYAAKVMTNFVSRQAIYAKQALKI